MSGIVCKVWNIKSSSSKKSSNAQIGDSLKYILNEEKTGAKIPSMETSDEFNEKQLGRECRYIENDIKTMEGAYVGYVNLSSVDVNDAVKAMMDVKKFYGKLDGRAALHGIISLPVEESDPANAPKLMALCESVLKEIFHDHQAVFAVHTNTENLHIHFIVNSVGLNGKKIHQPKRFVSDVLQPCINKYAEQYGFLQNDKWKENKKENYSEKTRTKYVEHKIRLRKVIDDAIENSNTFEEFIDYVKGEDVTINVGKHISVLYGDMIKPIRSYQLGKEYSKDEIIERLRIKNEVLSDFKINDYLVGKNNDDNRSFDPAFGVLKRYKDMDSGEREEVIKQLKQGVNPWKRHINTSWQMKEIADDLNLSSRINGYVKAYSKDGSLEGTLYGILDLKKKIQGEKKEADQIFKKYKSMMQVFDEMEVIEKKAYLYEHEGVKSYKTEYEQFRELTRRLNKNYGHNFEEVYEFKNRYINQKIYAEAQLQELSLEYREIKKYCESHGLKHEKGKSLYDILNIAEDKEYAKYGAFEADKKYVVSKENPDVILSIAKSPMQGENGRMIESYEISVMNINGKVLRTIDSKEDMGEFKKAVFEIQKFYRLDDCREFNKLNSAKEYVNISESKLNNYRGKEKTEIKTYSFTEAVNMLNPDRKDDYYVISDESSKEYMIIVSYGKRGDICLSVINEKGRTQEEVFIPDINKKEKNGFEKIQLLKNKYGFSDKMAVFNSIDDARDRRDQRDMERRRRLIDVRS